MRFALASAVLLLVFARRRPLRGVLQPGMWQRLLLMGALDAFTLLAYFFAVRSIGVAVATFFLFLQPVWVAFLAPRFLHAATERIVYFALSIAVAGMALILWPSFTGSGVSLSVARPRRRPGGGVGLHLLPADRERADTRGLERHPGHRRVHARRAVPPAAGLLAVAGRDRVSRRATGSPRVIMGLVSTAIAYTMWMDGVARIRVQHSSILGLLTPVAAPIYAFVLLGQGITSWTIAGGALILFAGVLVVVFGAGEAGPEPPL